MSRPTLEFFAVFFLGWFSLATPSVRAETEVSAQAARLWLVDGGVYDWETGEPVEAFRVIPGVPMSEFEGHESIGAVWQPHQIREMSGGKFQWPRTTGYKKMRFRVEAEGYQPSMTPWTERGGPYTKMRVYLRRDLGIEGTVVDADGEPVDDAIMAIGLPNRHIELDGVSINGIETRPSGRLSDRWRVPEAVRSETDGRFRLPSETDPSAVLCVVHSNGILVQPFEEIRERYKNSKPLKLRLQRWAVIQGRVAWKDSVGADVLLNLSTPTEYTRSNLIASSQRVRTDQNGFYRFDHVPPGHCRISRTVEDPAEGTIRPIGVNGTIAYPSFGIETESGVTSKINIGGDGVTVKGNLVGLPAFDGLKLSLTPPNVTADQFRQMKAGGDLDVRSKWDVLRGRPEGKYHFRDDIPVSGDGSFEIKDVMTGGYRLTVLGAEGNIQFSVRLNSPDEIHIGRIFIQRKGPVEFGFPAAGP